MNVYDIITEQIIQRLQQGTIPWQQPWKSAGAPKNLVSKKEYRGINVFLLASQHHQSPYWLTFKQAQDLGGHIRKGEHGSKVVFWKMLNLETDDADAEDARLIPLLRYYTVFNVDQCDGITAPEGETVNRPFEPIQVCESVVAGMPNRPNLGHNDARAYYQPSMDWVNMPKPETFRSNEDYYSVLFHELTHSTGHQSRLNRSTLTDLCPFGSTNYSKEELVAEMGAAFLCGHTGIENCTIDNSAAYTKGWLTRLQNDAKLVVIAAAQAQKAADYILGRGGDR